MKRAIILFLSLILPLCLSACESDKYNSFSETASVPFSTADSLREDPLRVIVEYAPGGQKGFDYINDMLYSYGFNLVFETYSPDGNEDSSDFIRRNINDNAVFMLNLLYDKIEELHADGLLGDFYDDGMIFAPMYMSHPAVGEENDPGTLYIMRTSFKKVYPVYPAVLVREDIAAEYGVNIRMASQYVELLEWLKERDPASIPGMAAANSLSNNSNMPYDLFLPEQGYWNSGDSCWYVFDIGTRHAHMTHTLTDSQNAIEAYAGLQRDGLLYLRNSYDPNGRTYDEFPTALLYAYDFIDPVSLDRSSLAGFDASGYRMYTLYNQQLPAIEWGRVNYYFSSVNAVAGRQTDVSEFLRLLEWLGYRDNYNSLFYGEEGTDYVLRGGRMVFSDENRIDWTAVRANLLHFERSEFKPIPLTAPSNYEDELQSLSPAYTISLTEQDTERFAAWWESLSKDEVDRIYESMSGLFKVNNDLFLSATPLDEEQTKAIIGEYMNGQSEREALLETYVGFVDEIFSNAEVR